MVKIERSFPAPPSLAKEKTKAHGSYREEDVIALLMQDFHGRCYICTMNELTDIQVEHLYPHNGGKNIDLKFDWENLFLSCPHCNSIKNQKAYQQIINCCKIDPEDVLTFECTEESIQAVNIADTGRPDHSEITATAQLITEVFNTKNTGIRTVTTQARVTRLLKEMNTLYKALEKYKKDKSSRYERALKGLLKKESPFASFKRTYIRKHENTYEEILSYNNSPLVT